MKGDDQWAKIVEGFAYMRGGVNAGKAHRVWAVMNSIRRAKCFPDAYLDGVLDEMFQMLAQPLPREARASVYLAFHGLENRASFLKVGVAVDVKKRMRELYTGNPFPRLWTFEAELPSRSAAYRTEGALHHHLRPANTSGEWFQVHGLSESAACGFAESLAEVATEMAGASVEFKRSVA